MSGDSATIPQVEYALSMIKKLGYSEWETIDTLTGRKLKLPVGSTIKVTVGALTKTECSALITRLKDETED